MQPDFWNQNITLRLDSNAQLRGVTVTNQAERGTAVWIESRSPILANNTFTVVVGRVFLSPARANP
jgi:hypothetical protein